MCACATLLPCRLPKQHRRSSAGNSSNSSSSCTGQAPAPVATRRPRKVAQPPASPAPGAQVRGSCIGQNEECIISNEAASQGSTATSKPSTRCAGEGQTLQATRGIKDTELATRQPSASPVSIRRTGPMPEQHEIHGVKEIASAARMRAMLHGSTAVSKYSARRAVTSLN
eukprot:1159574-Pelagomonas_calceolata.AAC.3